MTGALDGLVALVTGAESGIGAEVAVRLALDGAAVGVNGLSAEEVSDTIARIAGDGGLAVAVVGDVSDPADAERMVRETVEQLGGLHVLVNNAGLQQETPFLELETWRRQLSVDLDGAFLMAREACRVMARQGTGVVINVTSVHEHQPRPGCAAYCTAQAGLGMHTRVIARELADRGIRAVAVRRARSRRPSRATGPRTRSASRRPASPPGGSVPPPWSQA